MFRFIQTIDSEEARDRNHWTGKHFPKWLDRLRDMVGKIGKGMGLGILFLVFAAYIGVSLFVMYDYLTKQYGVHGNLFCSFGAKEQVLGKVVRVIGGYSEGTGFFTSQNQILTNFHVIAGEPSPKIVLPDGNFITPVSIIGHKDADLAVINTKESYPQLVLPMVQSPDLSPDEPLFATGYAMGTSLAGKPTALNGAYVDLRTSRHAPVSYIQTTISLVEGMSGGPLTDLCGKVIGVNTAGLAGLSLFISSSDVFRLKKDFTEQDITKITVDPSRSPEDAVTAFYTYLKARRMQEGFDLLSDEYLQKTNFTEWTSRFANVLDVTVITSEPYKKTKDTVHVKFMTRTWVDGEAETSYYEGTWQTIKEDGVYKMRESNIGEVSDPSMDWFYMSAPANGVKWYE